MCVLVCLCALWNLPTSKGNQVLAVGEGREACDMWRWRGRVLKNLKKKKKADSVEQHPPPLICSLHKRKKQTGENYNC
jgi:hypothetical protein